MKTTTDLLAPCRRSSGQTCPESPRCTCSPRPCPTAPAPCRRRLAAASGCPDGRPRHPRPRSASPVRASLGHPPCRHRCMGSRRVITQHHHWAVTSTIITAQIHQKLRHPTSSHGSYITHHHHKNVTSSKIITQHFKAVTIYITQHHHKAVTSPNISRKLHLQISSHHHHKAVTSLKHHKAVTSLNIITRMLHHPTSPQGYYIIQHHHREDTSPNIITGKIHHPTSSQGRYITQHHHWVVGHTIASLGISAITEQSVR